MTIFNGLQRNGVLIESDHRNLAQLVTLFESLIESWWVVTKQTNHGFDIRLSIERVFSFCQRDFRLTLVGECGDDCVLITNQFYVGWIHDPGWSR